MVVVVVLAVCLCRGDVFSHTGLPCRSILCEVELSVSVFDEFVDLANPYFLGRPCFLCALRDGNQAKVPVCSNSCLSSPFVICHCLSLSPMWFSQGFHLQIVFYFPCASFGVVNPSFFFCFVVVELSSSSS